MHISRQLDKEVFNITVTGTVMVLDEFQSRTDNLDDNSLTVS